MPECDLRSGSAIYLRAYKLLWRRTPKWERTCPSAVMFSRFDSTCKDAQQAIQ